MKRYLGNLDIIRFICGALIVMHHYQGLLHIRFSGVNFWGGNDSGWSFGYVTELFFIISGFLAVYSKDYDKMDLYYLRNRFLRLFPMALLSNLTYLFVVVLYSVISGQDMYMEHYSGVQIFCSLLLMGRGWIVDFAPPFNGPMWYVNVLLLCYILMFLVEKSITKLCLNKIMTYMGIVATAVVLNYLMLYFPFFWSCNARGYISFFMGVIVAYVFCKDIATRYKYILSVLGGFVYIIIRLVLGKFNYYGMVLFAYPAIILFITCLPQIKSKVIRFIGAIQYEVYLWNVPIYSFGVLLMYICRCNIEHSYFTMLCFVLCIELIGGVLYLYLEEPINKIISSKTNK